MSASTAVSAGALVGPERLVGTTRPPEVVGAGLEGAVVVAVFGAD